MLKLVIFIPKTHTDQLKERLWEAGLGKQGEYENCAFTSDGIGSFKPLEGANPTIGNIFDFEKVEEHRVEMLCEEKLKEIAISIIKKYHPYEEPAYEFYKIYT